MAREGIAKGVRGNNRKPHVYQHRLIKYLNALDKLVAGTVDPSYVAQRGKKFAEVKDWQ